MIASTQITNTEIFAFTAAKFCLYTEKQQKLLKSRLLLNKKEKFVGESHG